MSSLDRAYAALQSVASLIAPDEMIRPSEWAALYRVLPGHVSEPGPWRNERTPYLVGIMDAFCDPVVGEVVVKKSAQLGFSESMRNVVGWIIDRQPGPMMLVMPNEPDCMEVLEEEYKPMLVECDRLHRYITSRAWDIKSKSIKLAHMNIFTAWATSAAKLARRPIRYAFLDEVNKFPAQTGKEADPISLARVRTRTYGYRRKIFLGSTPTIPGGMIEIEFESCHERRHYEVPCPQCKRFQRITFPQIKWPEMKDVESAKDKADAVQAMGSAWLECVHCKGRIIDRDKSAMLGQGLWVSDNPGCQIMQGRKVGFHIWAAYSPWVTFSEIAAEFLNAVHESKRGNVGPMQHFRNSTCGETFEDQVTTINAGDIKVGCGSGLSRGMVPRWAHGLTMSADTQQSGFWWMLTAWGYGRRAHVCDYGFAVGTEQLAELVNRPREVVGGGVATPLLLTIDAGGGVRVDDDSTTTDLVYRFCLSDPDRFIPVKGNSKPQVNAVMLRRSTGTVGGASYNLHLLDTNRLKDRLANQLVIDAGGPGSWSVFDGVGEDYVRQMASEHKVRSLGKGEAARWEQKTPGAANHLWDCAVYAMAAAEIAGVDSIEEEDVPPHLTQVKSESIMQRGGSSGQSQPKNWVTGWKKYSV